MPTTAPKNSPPGDTPWKLKNRPYLDRWMETLNTALAPRGRKTQLAKFLATATQKPLTSTAPQVARIANNKTTPSAETLLIINHWLKIINSISKNTPQSPTE